MSEGKISPREAGELAVCFQVHVRDLFGYACVLTRGDHALAPDLIQPAFEAAAGAWPALRGLAEKTVSVHLYRVRRKLLLQLGAGYSFDDGTAERAWS